MLERRQALFEFLSREVDAPAALSADLTLAPAPATHDSGPSSALDVQRAQVRELELGVAALGLPVAPWMDEDHAGSSLEALAEGAAVARAVRGPGGTATGHPGGT